MSAMQMPLLPEYGVVDVTTMVLHCFYPPMPMRMSAATAPRAALAHDERVDVELE